MNIIEFIRDPELIGGDLSPFQETVLRLQYGLPLDDKQLVIARVGLDREPPEPREYAEGTLICGRRGGKSDRFGANIGVYEAAVGGHEKYLTAGERGHIVIIAQDMRATRVLKRYILAKLQRSPLLSQLVDKVRAEEIDLTNGLTISIFPCSFRAPRGFSIPVAILDEVAFFRVEGVNVDKDVIDAIRPAQATFPHAKLIKISTPYAKAGELYRDFASRASRPDLLCFQASSAQMNPSIPQTFLDSERERDSEYFDREYLAQFTDSVSNAFTREAVEACVVTGRFELPFSGAFSYHAGVDPSGGGADEFALSVVHRERERVVEDCLRAYRSKKPGDVVAEMATVLRDYKIQSVTGDRYSAEWVRSAFQDLGIRYDVCELTTSECFLELLPQINQGTIELLDDKRQTAQLIALERRKSRAGKDSISHPAGGHDDRCAALAAAVTQAVGGNCAVGHAAGETRPAHLQAEGFAGTYGSSSLGRAW